MKITKQFLEKWHACSEGVEWVLSQNTDDAITLVNRLIEHNLGWANWLVVRCLEPRRGQLRYAIYAAESVIGIFEEKYPNDTRPRLAVDAAKKVLKNDTQVNRDAAARAAGASWEAWAESAGSSAWASRAASASWASSAKSAASASWASSAESAAGASWAAANAAARATSAERFRKIIKHGLKLLRKQEKTK